MSESLGANEVREIKDIPVRSFETEMGSVYTYDSDGKTTRFKTVDKTQHDKKDLTVFIDLNTDESQKVSNAYINFDGNFKFCVLEIKDDNSLEIINKKEDIKNLDRLRFGILNVQKEKWAFLKNASLTPTVGYTVFEVGESKKGKDLVSQHLGHKVTKINY